MPDFSANSEFHIQPDKVRPLGAELVEAAELWDLTGALAGKIGISPDRFGTLPPIRPPSESLLVPIDVQAFVSTTGNAEPRADVATATSPEGATMMPPPFTDTDPLPPGVHLHWAMPDALTRADPEANDDPDDLVLPPIPDRWLVVRMGPPRAGQMRRTTTAWVIESDQPDRAVPLAEWKNESTTTPERLDVVVGGDPAWAAVYDNVADRFGFHDELTDAGNGPFSYVVIGWFSVQKDDPLSLVNRSGSLGDLLEEFGWARPGDGESDDLGAAVEAGGGFTIDAGATRIVATKRQITRSVYHGCVFGVRTATPRRSDDPRPPANKVSMALGRSGPTALAELLTTDPEQRDVLAAVSAAVADLLLDSDGGDALVAHLHQLGFISAPGGTVTEFVRKMADPRRGFLPGSAGIGGILDRTHPQAGKIASMIATTESVDGLLGLRDRAIALERLLPGEEPPGDATDELDQADLTRIEPSVAHLAETSGYSLGSRNGRKYDVLVDAKAGVSIVDLVAGATAGGPGSTGDIRLREEFVPVQRPLPRFHQPTDPVLQLRGIGRARRHGEDGRFDEAGDLLVRTTSQIISGYRKIVQWGSVVFPLGHGGLPPEADRLLGEAALLDPTAVEKLPGGVFEKHLPAAEVRGVLQAERALTDLLISDVKEAWPLLNHSRRIGITPSPVALRRWAQPWVPIYIEWEVDAATTEATERGWRLDELDLEPTGQPPPADRFRNRRCTSREIVTPAAARTLGDAINRFLDAENELDEEGRGVLSATDESALGLLAATLANADLVTVGLAGLEERLAGWETTSTVVDLGDDHVEPVPTAADPTFIRAGACRLRRLRVVDAYGRVLDLTGRLGSLGLSDDVEPAPEPGASLSEGPGPAVHMRPRLTTLARLMFRLRDATDDNAEAALDDRRPASHRNPIAGWLLPDHADDAIEMFDANGDPVGQLFHRGTRREVTYEGTPGEPGPIGTAAPRGDATVPGFDHVANISDAIVRLDAVTRRDTATDADPVESPLSALLRAVDTTLWTTDPFGAIGLEHPSILTGRPIAVVRASITLDIPNDTADHALTAEQAKLRNDAFERLANRGFVVRLGSLGRMDDGLLGWFLDDDYTTFHPVHPAVRDRAAESGPGKGFLSTTEAAAAHGQTANLEPIRSDFVSGGHEVTLYPNERRTITLLMHPGLGVHLTSGFLPRKRLELARQWTEEALTRILPSFRFGPVLVDPDVVRMPRVSARTNTQTWARRTDPTTWRDDPIVAATSTAHLPDRPARLEEGWVRIRPDEEEG